MTKEKQVRQMTDEGWGFEPLLSNSSVKTSGSENTTVKQRREHSNGCHFMCIKLIAYK